MNWDRSIDTTNVNKPAIREWVDELRSGVWRQGRGRLQQLPPAGSERSDQFCCLGVACKVFGPRIDLPATGTTDDGFGVKYHGSATYLPPLMAEHLFGDESIDDPYVHTSGTGRAVVSSLNDNGYSFAEIADLIEATYLSEGDGDSGE